MNDLISRKGVSAWLYNMGHEKLSEYVLDEKRFSSEKRSTGKWIFEPKDAIELMFTKPKCSECGFESADGGNFCSNCGAKMKWVK